MQVTPDDARLWCSLGDLTLEDAHFHTAWERSGRRSVRAQRSLARSAHRQQKYTEVGRSAGPCCGLPGQGSITSRFGFVRMHASREGPPTLAIAGAKHLGLCRGSGL